MESNHHPLRVVVSGRSLPPFLIGPTPFPEMETSSDHLADWSDSTDSSRSGENIPVER